MFFFLGDSSKGCQGDTHVEGGRRGAGIAWVQWDGMVCCIKTFRKD